MQSLNRKTYMQYFSDQIALNLKCEVQMGNSVSGCCLFVCFLVWLCPNVTLTCVCVCQLALRMRAVMSSAGERESDEGRVTDRNAREGAR